MLKEILQSKAVGATLIVLNNNCMSATEIARILNKPQSWIQKQTALLLEHGVIKLSTENKQVFNKKTFMIDWQELTNKYYSFLCSDTAVAAQAPRVIQPHEAGYRTKSLTITQIKESPVLMDSLKFFVDTLHSYKNYYFSLSEIFNEMNYALVYLEVLLLFNGQGTLELNKDSYNFIRSLFVLLPNSVGTACVMEALKKHEQK